MPITHVSPDPQLCDYLDLIDIDGYFTTVQNVHVDERHSEVIIDLFTDDDEAPRYVHSIEIPVARHLLDSVTADITADWVKEVCGFQAARDHLTELHAAPAGRH